MERSVAEFTAFPKIARMSREMIVTEKIDGTNAQVCIVETDGFEDPDAVYQDYGLAMYVGSRKRWITPEHDNFGFAAWCLEHANELLCGLGPGRHFGEWWGKGIQRGYGLSEKRFSLFNTVRWCEYGREPERIVTGDPRQEKYQEVLPECCGLVPVIVRCAALDTEAVDDALDVLRVRGSYAAPGYMNPEGVVVYHVAGNVSFKKTFVGDESGKGREPQHNVK
jgi:hypothetical protein